MAAKSVSQKLVHKGGGRRFVQNHRGHSEKSSSAQSSKDAKPLMLMVQYRGKQSQ